MSRRSTPLSLSWRVNTLSSASRSAISFAGRTGYSRQLASFFFGGSVGRINATRGSALSLATISLQVWCIEKRRSYALAILIRTYAAFAVTLKVFVGLALPTISLITLPLLVQSTSVLTELPWRWSGVCFSRLSSHISRGSNLTSQDSFAISYFMGASYDSS